MTQEITTEKKTFQTSGVAIISFAHAVHDSYTAFLSTLLPLLIERLSITNTFAGFLSIIMRLPSLFQPVIGHLADRKNLRLLIVLTPAITGAAMSLLGVANSQGFVIFLLVIAGASSAALHAIGPVVGSTFSGDRLGKGMSFWMVGGELGRTLGPLVVVFFIGYLTIEKLPWAMLAGVLASIFLFFGLSKVTTQSVEVQEKVDWLAALRNMRGFMLPLVGMMVTRAMLIATFNTFLTTYMTAEGSSLSLAGLSLSILELAGVVGAFLSGVLSDKIGRIRMLVISFIFTPIFMLLFVQSTGVIKILLLILVGFFGLSVTPVMMAIVIESYPEQKSFANGMYMMVNFIISAVAVLLVGFLSDLVTLRFAFLISTAILPFGLFFIWLLRREKDKGVEDAPSV